MEHESSRKIDGFDAFGKFPTRELSSADDFKFVKAFTDDSGEGLHEDELSALLERKQFTNIELVRGSVLDTLPGYLDVHPKTRLSFLQREMDIKEPTAFALECLYDRVVPNGLIVFDGYNTVAGETQAVDAFIARKNPCLEKLPYYNVPAFVRKPA